MLVVALMARPKPEGAVAKLCGPLAMPSINKVYALLRRIADNADIQMAESPHYHRDCKASWLLVNISAADLDALMNIEAPIEDIEPDVDNEEACDYEGATCEDEGVDSDGETDLVSTERFGSLRIDDRDAKEILTEYRDEARQACRQRNGYCPIDLDDEPFSDSTARAAKAAEIVAVRLHPNIKL